MKQYQMSNCDGVLTSSSTASLGRKKSPTTMPCQDVIRDTVGHNDNVAVSQRGDEDCIAPSTNVSKIPQSTGKDLVPVVGREAKIRRRVFDEIMSHSYHFGSQRVDPTAKINSSLAQGNEGMFFGDLDFDADAAAFDFGEYDPTPNEKPATFPEVDIASSHNQSSNDRTATVHDPVKLGVEGCARESCREEHGNAVGIDRCTHHLDRTGKGVNE